MNDRQEVTTRSSDEPREAGREPEFVLRPAVDIFEDGEGITLVADMPGVSRDRLDLQVDKDMLMVEGDASIDMPEGMEPLHADVRSTKYRRGFTLSGELDTAQIEARLENGVLTVRIPKRAEVRPRKIEVQTG